MIFRKIWIFQKFTFRKILLLKNLYPLKTGTLKKIKNRKFWLFTNFYFSIFWNTFQNLDFQKFGPLENLDYFSKFWLLLFKFFTFLKIWNTFQLGLFKIGTFNFLGGLFKNFDFLKISDLLKIWTTFPNFDFSKILTFQIFGLWKISVSQKFWLLNFDFSIFFFTI